MTQALVQITSGMMVEQLPCSSCTAMCCGPVPISEARLQGIRDHLNALPAGERKRLGKQERGYLDCGFLDKDNYHCMIYPMRPFVCEAFGRVADMACPKVGKLVQIIPLMTENAKLAEEAATPIAASSDRWNWKRMDFE
jgi:Fe-S-cluster containining protein